MERYKILEVIGNGSYGTVYKAIKKRTGELFAIKKMKRSFTSWEECMELREVRILRKLIHPNIVRLKEVLKVEDNLYFIFEFAGQNIYELTKALQLENASIRSIIFQILLGLSHMHNSGYFHRDVKPENLLIQNKVVKIADFNLAKEMNVKIPMTDYVSTRWYRAPEMLLRSGEYNWQVDIFALGAVMGELYIDSPLFPGLNERDQIIKICSVLGTPHYKLWPEGYRLASKLNFTFPCAAPVDMKKLIPNAPPEAIDLMLTMLNYNPQRRPTARECLMHSYFYEEINKHPFTDEDTNIHLKRQNFNKLRAKPNKNKKANLTSDDMVVLPSIVGSKKCFGKELSPSMNLYYKIASKQAGGSRALLKGGTLLDHIKEKKDDSLIPLKQRESIRNKRTNEYSNNVKQSSFNNCSKSTQLSRHRLLAAQLNSEYYLILPNKKR